MSAVVAGMTRGVAEVVDSFVRPPPMAVEIHKLTGHRVTVVRDEIMISCDAETARALWDKYDVYVDVRQYVVVEGVRSWSNEQESGVNWTGGRFPVYHRFIRRWRGHMTTVDAEFTVVVRVPAGRRWEHRRWADSAGAAAIEAPDPPETPEAHIPRMLRGEEVAAGIRFMAVLR